MSLIRGHDRLEVESEMDIDCEVEIHIKDLQLPEQSQSTWVNKSQAEEIINRLKSAFGLG